MTHLETAQSIVKQLEGTTSTVNLSNGISALNDLLMLQKAEVQKAHKAVNAAKEAEDAEKLTLKIMENCLDKLKRARQELRDERFSNGL